MRSYTVTIASVGDAPSPDDLVRVLQEAVTGLNGGLSVINVEPGSDVWSAMAKILAPAANDSHVS